VDTATFTQTDDATERMRALDFATRQLSASESDGAQAVARAQRYLAFLKDAKDVTTPEAISE
jgi:hypothetical protein